MADKAFGNNLPGFTPAETIVMAAAWYHARSADVDFEKVVAHVGSKSVASVRERLRLCKKKDIQIEGVVPSLSSPPGGVDKKAAGKVNGSPRKTTGKGKTKPGTKSTVKKEQDDGNESEHTASNGAPMPEVHEGV